MGTQTQTANKSVLNRTITPTRSQSPTPSTNSQKESTGEQPFSNVAGDAQMDMEDAKHKARVIAHELFAKYCQMGAEYEINIPHWKRKKLMDVKLDVLEDWTQKTRASVSDLFTLFDECMDEMFTLMTTNLALFLQSPDYHKIANA